MSGSLLPTLLICLGGAVSVEAAKWADALHVRLPRQAFNRSVLGHAEPGLRITGSVRPPRTHEFVSTITLGTPPQKLTCLIDTGLSGIWVVPKHGCSDCAMQGRFDVNESSTFTGMTATEAQAPTYLGDRGKEVLTGLPFKDTIGIGPMKLAGQGLKLLTSAPSHTRMTKGTDWDSICGLSWPGNDPGEEHGAAMGEAPNLAVHMLRTGGHSVFTLAPGLGERSFVVAGEVPQTIYKQGTLVWAPAEPLEPKGERSFWVASGQAEIGAGPAQGARFLIDSGTSFIYVPPRVLWQDIVGAFFDEKHFIKDCSVDPEAGNLLVCACSVLGHLEGVSAQLAIKIDDRRFLLDMASLFEKVPATDGGEDLCLPLVQPNMISQISEHELQRIENVADRWSQKKSAYQRSNATGLGFDDDRPAAAPDQAGTDERQGAMWILGGAFLERFVVVLDFEKARLGVAEPLVDSAPAITDPELTWFGENYKRLKDLDSDGNLMCADKHALQAPCGSCGPDWGDVTKCQALCNADTQCNYIVHSVDGGCRLYSSCENTVVMSAYSGPEATMHIYAKQTIPYKQVVADEHALCSPDKRIVASCGRCGPDWGDKGACERMCNSYHGCNYFAYLSDGGCRIYEDCVQFFAGSEDVTTEIYWKVTPFILDDEQVRHPPTTSSPHRGIAHLPETPEWHRSSTTKAAHVEEDVGATMANPAGQGTGEMAMPPWWAQHKVKPQGKKERGSWTAVAFSKTQQELFGVDEDGAVVDQARFDEALRGNVEDVPAPASPAVIDWLSDPDTSSDRPSQSVDTIDALANLAAGSSDSRKSVETLDVGVEALGDGVEALGNGVEALGDGVETFSSAAKAQGGRVKALGGGVEALGDGVVALGNGVEPWNPTPAPDSESVIVAITPGENDVGSLSDDEVSFLPPDAVARGLRQPGPRQDDKLLRHGGSLRTEVPSGNLAGQMILGYLVLGSVLLLGLWQFVLKRRQWQSEERWSSARSAKMSQVATGVGDEEGAPVAAE